MPTIDARRTHTARRRALSMQGCCQCLEDCDTRRDDFGIAGIIVSAGTSELLTEHVDSDQAEYAATRIFKFASQSNLPDFANFIIFVDFVLFGKAHYKKWGAVENRKLED